MLGLLHGSGWKISLTAAQLHDQHSAMVHLMPCIAHVTTPDRLWIQAEDTFRPSVLAESPRCDMQRHRRSFHGPTGLGGSTRHAASFNSRRQSTAIFKTMDLASAGKLSRAWGGSWITAMQRDQAADHGGCAHEHALVKLQGQV